MMTSLEHDHRDAVWIGDEDGLRSTDRVHEALDRAYQEGPPSPMAEEALQTLRSGVSKGGAEVAFYARIANTPVGELLVAKTSRGLAALAFSHCEKGFLDELESRTGLRAHYSPTELENETAVIEQYLGGERHSIDLNVDLRGLTDFQRMVLRTVSEVPRGEVITYGELAKRIRKPRAARAVGQALGRNPIPIVIPCHRVIASDGTLGGYSGERGIATKEALLKLEGAPFG
jgi:methylated-DNA-[protein]-cysteine S-methyltransferase